MRKVLYTLFFIVLINSCSPHKGVEPIEEILKDAETLYKRGLESSDTANEYFFQSAIKFEEAIEKGELNNGYVFFNTGNSWYNYGDTGRAVYYYNKALKRMPGNYLVKQNLMQAGKSIEFTVIEKEMNPFLKTLLFFHYDLSFKTRMILLFFTLLFLFTAASAILFYPKSYFKTVISLLSIISLIFIVSVLFDVFKAPEGVVLQAVSVRKGDSSGYEKVFNEDLSPGIEFSLQEERSGWYYIKLKDGSQGWIPGTAAILID